MISWPTVLRNNRCLHLHLNFDPYEKIPLPPTRPGSGIAHGRSGRRRHVASAPDAEAQLPGHAQGRSEVVRQRSVRRKPRLPEGRHRFLRRILHRRSDFLAGLVADQPPLRLRRHPNAFHGGAQLLGRRLLGHEQGAGAAQPRFVRSLFGAHGRRFRANQRPADGRNV